MEVIAKQINLNKITLDILLEYISKNCCNKQQQLEEITVDNNKDIEEIKINTINFKDKLKSSDKPIIFCPSFIKNFDYFKTNQDILVFNINSLDLSPTLSISSKKSSKDYNITFKSLFLSVLYCLKDNLKQLTDEVLEDFIVNTNKYIQLADLPSLNIKKIALNRNLKSHKVDYDVIRFLSDYLHVNIFIFDEKISDNRIIYCDNNFVPFKKNIILLLDNNIYYPVITNNYKIFKFNQSFMKFALSDISKIITYNNLDLNLTQEDLTKYINQEDLTKFNNQKNIANIIDINIQEQPNIIKDNNDNLSIINGFDDQYSPTEKDDNNSDADSEDSEDNDNTELNNKIEKYMNYSLKDLQKMSKDNNIDIKNKLGKFKTKKDLVDNLINLNK